MVSPEMSGVLLPTALQVFDRAQKRPVKLVLWYSHVTSKSVMHNSILDASHFEYRPVSTTDASLGNRPS